MRVNFDLVILGAMALAVIVCALVIRLWRLHGGHDNLPGDVMWGGVTTLAIYGLVAQDGYRIEPPLACALATGVFWAICLIVVHRKARRRSSVFRYYSQ